MFKMQLGFLAVRSELRCNTVPWMQSHVIHTLIVRA